MPMPATPQLPDWFYLARAAVAAIVGLAVIWQEATGDGRVLGYIAGLVLVGIFAPTDVIAWRQGGGGQRSSSSD